MIRQAVPHAAFGTAPADKKRAAKERNTRLFIVRRINYNTAVNLLSAKTTKTKREMATALVYNGTAR